jgi:hypothetical protein
MEMNWETGQPNWDMSLITAPSIQLNILIKDTEWADNFWHVSRQTGTNLLQTPGGVGTCWLFGMICSLPHGCMQNLDVFGWDMWV